MQSAFISGHVFTDVNANGVQDPGEAQGLGGFTVYLDSNHDGRLGSNETTAVMDGAGNYSFDGLTPGTYDVREVLQPENGWGLSVQLPTVTLTGDFLSGQNGAVVNIGNYRPASVSGRLLLNRSGTPGGEGMGLSSWTVYLDQNRNGVIDTSRTLPLPATDVPKGIADATFVQEGRDDLGEDVPAQTFSSLTVGGLTGLVTDLTVTLNIAGAREHDLDVDLISPRGTTVRLFGGVGSGSLTKTLSDFDNEDPNGTWYLGITDTKHGAAGTLRDWSLTLTSGEPSALTDVAGNYSFNGLRPGGYFVRERLRDGWRETAPGQDVIYDVRVTSGQDAGGFNFGNFPPSTVSLPGGVDRQAVTLTSSTGTGLSDVQTVANPSPLDTPLGASFPAGFLTFNVQGTGQNGSVTVTLTLPAGVTVNTYYKYGRAPGDSAPHWYPFLFDGTTGAEINGNVITLHFVDGQRGDDDLTANGSITDPGGPAFTAPPVLGPLTGPAFGVRGQLLAFAASFTDPGTKDTHTAVIDWGDGHSSAGTVVEAGGSGTVTGSHVYVASGAYTVRLTLTDKDGGVGAVASHTIAITVLGLQPDPLAPGKTMLVVGGTPNDDRIQIVPGRKRGDVAVRMNGRNRGTFHPTGRIVVYGQAGNDQILVSGGVTLPAWLYGGEGNDQLRGGGGDNVLIGGPGNDLLIGGRGRNLLMGGEGKNHLFGNAQNDLLVPGSTALDSLDAGLMAIMREWTSRHSYAVRLANVYGTGSGPSFEHRLNGDYFLPPPVGTSNGDVVIQSADLDWFFANWDRPVTEGMLRLLQEPLGKQVIAKLRHAAVREWQGVWPMLGR